MNKIWLKLIDFMVALVFMKIYKWQELWKYCTIPHFFFIYKVVQQRVMHNFLFIRLYLFLLFIYFFVELVNRRIFLNSWIGSHGLYPLQVQEQPGLWFHHVWWSAYCPARSEEDDNEQEEAQGHWWRSTDNQCHH